MIPFKPGQSGNPNGRPKGRRDFRTIFYAALERLASQSGETVDALEEQMHIAAIQQAVKGNPKFFKDLNDRIHGKAPETVQHTGKDGGPIHVRVNELSDDELQNLATGSESRASEA